MAAERDGRAREAFKVDKRRRFLDLLRNRGATSLLEVALEKPRTALP